MVAPIYDGLFAQSVTPLLRTLRFNVFEHWLALLWASTISARALLSGAKDIRFRSASVNVPRIGHRCAAHLLLVQKHQKSMRGENLQLVNILSIYK